jgi:hypothetical protein
MSDKISPENFTQLKGNRPIPPEIKQAAVERMELARQMFVDYDTFARKAGITIIMQVMAIEVGNGATAIATVVNKMVDQEKANLIVKAMGLGEEEMTKAIGKIMEELHK